MGIVPYTGFHLLAKPTGAICNLDCKYCFYLPQEALYPGSDFHMSSEVLEAYVRQYLECQPGPEINLAWQGGEPTLMGLDFFRRAVALAEKYQRPGTRLLHTIQTNGVLLDDEWCAFFAEHEFLVGLSLDGPREMHDVYRVDKGGHPTFDKVMAALQALQKHGVAVNILTTVHAVNAGRPLEVYRFLRDEAGAEVIQLIPIVERSTALVALGQTMRQRASARASDRSVTGPAFGRFLIAIFDEWVKRDVGRTFVQMFDSALASWVGEPGTLCVHAPTCGTALALEHTGDLYSCDHFVTPAHRLGNILERHMRDLVDSPAQHRFGDAKRDTLPHECRVCDVRFACHGGCPKDRFAKTRDGHEGLHYLCEGYKAFFRHVDRPMRIMASLLKAGRAPAGIMTRAAIRSPVGRNAPCPCGSGRKHKRCCGVAGRGLDA
jgi:uncharacterized protein